MSINRPLFKVTMFLAAIAITATACSGSSNSPNNTAKSTANHTGDNSPASSNTLTVVQVGDFQSFDPSQLPPGNWAALYQIYNTLTLENAKLQPQPRLATSWTFSADHLSLTLNLRKGVKFSDGTPFTADDVVWNIKRYKDPNTGANIKKLADLITSAVATDPNTVVLHFAQPAPNIFDALDLIFISKPQADKAIKTTPVGTGPFILDSWNPGNEATFSLNKYYSGPDKPHFQKLVVKDAPDPQSALDIFKAGQADVLVGPSWNDFASLSKDGSYTTMKLGEGSLVSGILFNTTQAPFNDPRVRQAVSYALDRKAFVSAYFMGQSTPWCLPWADGTEAYEASPDLSRNCPQNLTKAKQLLADAGYPKGFKTEILTSGEGYVPGATALAQVLQQDLAKVGITLKIDNVAPAAARSLYHGTKFAMAATAFGRATRDPATLFEATLPFATQGNEELFSSSQYTQLVNDVAHQADPATRKASFEQLSKFMLDQSFVITVAPSYRTFVLQKSVTGLTADADGMPLFENVKIGS